MKVSFLLPTVFPTIAKRAINCIRNGGVDDYEIVVCSNHVFAGDRIVFAHDKHLVGTDAATRQAFLASDGDLIIRVNDDYTYPDGIFARVVDEWKTHPEDLWSLGGDGLPGIFGKFFSAFPVCSREMIERLWPWFFPYVAHFGDPAFSLAVWREGHQVRPTSFKVSYGPDRGGTHEAPQRHSDLSYQFGAKRIFDDFPEFSHGWSRDPAVFNHPVG